MYRRASLCAACLLLLAAGISAANVRDPAQFIEDTGSIATPQAPTEDPLCLYYEDFQAGPAGWVAQELSAAPIRWNPVSYDGLQVMWCGVDDPTYPGGPGYGNNWNEYLFKSFTLPGGPITLSCRIQYDSEPGFDYTYVEVSNDGGATFPTVLAAFTGSSGFLQQNFDLSAFAGQVVTIRFQFVSDGGYSNEDGGYVSVGACRLDWVEVTGSPRDEFTGGDDGWHRSGGSYGRGFRLVTLPFCNPSPAPPCDMYCTAWVAYDNSGSFPYFLYPEPYRERRLRLAIESPLIQLPGDATSYFLDFDAYMNLPYENNVFLTYEVAAPAPEYGGVFRPFEYLLYGNSGNVRWHRNITSLVQPGATTMKVRLVAIDVSASVGGPLYPHTPAPFFDNVSITALGTDAPGISCAEYPRFCNQGYTPPGSDVEVNPIDPGTGGRPVTLTFGTVTNPGSTSVTTDPVGPPPPPGFAVGTPPVYYDVQTTATFTGSVELCIDYTGITFRHEAELQLWHFEGGAWVNSTTSLDTIHHMICGVVSSLSPFLVAEPSPLGVTEVTPGPAPSCVDLAHPCVTMPVTISRTTAEEMRGFSVDLELSPNLQLCGAGITEGTYLNSIATTQFEVVDNGAGSWTVDCAILGATCGQTAGTGLLFNVPVGRVSSDGTGTLTVTSVTLRDCDNAPIAGTPGPPLSITIDTARPATITNLAAAQVKSGNGTDGTTMITLTFTAPGDAAVVEVYRAPWGGYPEYDDAGFATPPALPGYPPALPWTLTGVTASGQTDEPTARDVWYYVAYTKDACGNVSLASNRTAGTLNYHLGDTHNGFAACAGDNHVDTGDVSFLGAHYGATLGYPDALACLDVGPTANFGVDTRPMTDNRIQFEDLMMFAVNYGQVSKPELPTRELAGGPNVLALRTRPAAGDMLEAVLNLTAGGNLQGLSVDLGFDPGVVRPLDVVAGPLLGAQDAPTAALSAQPGNVDAAILGRGATLRGSGELAVMRFEIVGAGDPAITLARAEGRDTHNQPVHLDQEATAPALMATGLHPAYPNPFRTGLRLPLSLVAAGPVRLQIFDVSGRLVTTLLDREMPAGETTIEWSGAAGSGQPVADGLYLARMQAAGKVFVRRLMKSQ